MDFYAARSLARTRRSMITAILIALILEKDGVSGVVDEFGYAIRGRCRLHQIRWASSPDSNFLRFQSASKHSMMFADFVFVSGDDGVVASFG